MNNEERLIKELEPYHDLINEELTLVKSKIPLTNKEYYKGYFDGEKKVHTMIKEGKSIMDFHNFEKLIDNANVNTMSIYQHGCKRGFKFFKYLWIKLQVKQYEETLPF